MIAFAPTGRPGPRISEARHVSSDREREDEAIETVGRMFHDDRKDTADIASAMFLPQAVVCRYLDTYRRRRRQ